MSGYILEGRYIKTDKIKKEVEDTATTHQQWSHDRQRERHKRDLIQPYKNGKPSEEFIQQYPQESKERGLI